MVAFFAGHSSCPFRGIYKLSFWRDIMVALHEEHNTFVRDLVVFILILSRSNIYLCSTINNILGLSIITIRTLLLINSCFTYSILEVNVVPQCGLPALYGVSTLPGKISFHFGLFC